MKNDQISQDRIKWWDEHVNQSRELSRSVFIQTGAWPMQVANEPSHGEGVKGPLDPQEQMHLCAAIARRFGATVVRCDDPDDHSGYAVLVYQGQDLAEVGFGPDIRLEFFAWFELTQVALAIARYEQLRSLPAVPFGCAA